MQASSTVVARPPATADPATRLSRGLVDPVLNGFREAGRIVVFSAEAFRELLGVWRYSAEVLRQVSILITGSAAVIWLGSLLFGMSCGEETTNIFKGLGATSYAGLLTGLCQARVLLPLIFAWFFTAKVAAGFAAELGAMRISDELPAMEAVGINTMSYVVATRLAAVLITMPFIYFVLFPLLYSGFYAVVVAQTASVSFGRWNAIHWQYQNQIDYLYSLIFTLTLITAPTLIALYHGYNARGGPIGVGRATAKAMAVSLVTLQILHSLLTVLFYGPDPKLPIGG